MAYSAPPAVTTGQLATASDHNTYTKDNIIYLFAPTVQTKTGTYTVVETDAAVVVTSGSFTLTLYAASGKSGRFLEVINVGSGVVTIDGNASETIGGATTWALQSKQSIRIRCDGTNWQIVAVSSCQAWKEEITLPISYFRPHASGGCGALEDVLLSSGRYIGACPFDGTSIERATCELEMPKRWNLGTFTFQPYGFNTAGGSGDVVFSMAAVASGDNESMDAAVGTAQTSTDTVLAAKNRAIGPESSAITISGTPVAGDGIRFDLWRDPTAGGDTYASDYYISAVKLRFTMIAVNDE